MPQTAKLTLKALMKHAQKAARGAYAPYSKFQVGAAIELTGGQIVTGVNVENASYGLTICAERSALVRAVSQFGPKIRIRTIAVANRSGQPSPPCGACRQMLAEFALPDAQVAFPADDGVKTMTFSDLIPEGFHLKKK